MRKEDFHKGQTVWAYLIGSSAIGKKTTEERIKEWEVISVGKKYVVAKPKDSFLERETRFEIENGFYKDGCCIDNCRIYLTKEDIFNDVWRSQTREYIRRCTQWESPIVGTMSDEDLQTVLEIFKKYDKDGGAK